MDSQGREQKGVEPTIDKFTFGKGDPKKERKWGKEKREMKKPLNAD